MTSIDDWPTRASFCHGAENLGTGREPDLMMITQILVVGM